MMSTALKSTAFKRLRYLPVLAVALIWAGAALAKFIAAPDAAANTWASEFPGWLMMIVSLAEATTAAVIFSGRRLLGILMGMVLLLGFLAALLLWPPSPGQSCGCLGAITISTSPTQVASHIFAFASLRLLAAVAMSTQAEAMPSRVECS